MIDRREQLLARMVAICASLNPTTSGRNILAVDDIKRPALIVLDGDEQASGSDPITRPNNAPRRLMLESIVHVLVDDVPGEVGTTLNIWRRQLISAIESDATLRSLTQADGTVRYVGLDVGMMPARNAAGAMYLKFQLTYWLRINELT